MSDLGLKEMANPVLIYMRYSGQLLPKLHPLSILRWIITAGSLVLITILASVELAISAVSKLGSALEIITILLTFLEMCFRVIYLSYNEPNIAKVIKSSHYFPVSCSAFICSERRMREKAMAVSRRTQLLFSGYVFVVLTGYLSLPFLPTGPVIGNSTDITASIVNPARKRPLYIPVWLPFINNVDDLASPAYEFFVVWQAWSFVILVCTFCAADCLLYTFIAFILEGLEHLKRVVPGKRTRQHRLTAPISGMFPENLVAWSLNVRRDNYKHQTELEYKVWVRQHQFLLSLGKELESLFSPIIFGTFVVNGTVLCVLAYVLVKQRTVVGILCVFGHFSCILIKLYVMAKFGQRLMDHSKSLGPESVSKIWPRMGENRRKDARIIGIRCSDPITLTGHGFFALGVEIFGRVCVIAMSYFIVLLQLH